jgi:hypothetical protein
MQTGRKLTVCVTASAHEVHDLYFVIVAQVGILPLPTPYNFLIQFDGNLLGLEVQTRDQLG